MQDLATAERGSVIYLYHAAIHLLSVVSIWHLLYVYVLVLAVSVLHEVGHLKVFRQRGVTIVEFGVGRNFLKRRFWVARWNLWLGFGPGLLAFMAQVIGDPQSGVQPRQLSRRDRTICYGIGVVVGGVSGLILVAIGIIGRYFTYPDRPAGALIIAAGLLILAAGIGLGYRFICWWAVPFGGCGLVAAFVGLAFIAHSTGGQDHYLAHLLGSYSGSTMVAGYAALDIAIFNLLPYPAFDGGKAFAARLGFDFANWRNWQLVAWSLGLTVAWVLPLVFW